MEEKDEGYETGKVIASALLNEQKNSTFSINKLCNSLGPI